MTLYGVVKTIIGSMNNRELKFKKFQKRISRTIFLIIALCLVYLVQNVAFGQTKAMLLVGGGKQENKKVEKVSQEKVGHKKNKVRKTNTDKFSDGVIIDISTRLKSTWLGKIASPLVVTLLFIPVLILFSYFLGLLSRLLIIRPIIRIWKKRTVSETHRALIDKISPSFNPFFIVLGIRLTVVPLEAYFNSEIYFLRAPTQALLILFIAIIFQRTSVALISIWGEKIANKTHSNVDDQLLPLFLGILKSGILVFGVIIALSTMGINMAPLVASLGALSFALGFAVKDSLSNFIAGIFLVLENAFQVDDKIDVAGIGVGFIHEVGLRTTKLRTFDNEIIVIPNNTLMNKHFKNFRLPDLKIRIVVEFGVAYGSDVVKVREVVSQEIEAIEGRLEDMDYVVEFRTMADFALLFAAKFYVNNYADQNTKKLEATDKIYHRLMKENIEIPYPTYSIIKKDS